MKKEEMYESIKKYNKTKDYKDYIVAEAKYLTKRVEYEIAMAKSNKQEEFGMGFIMAVHEFNGNKTVLDFFAKCMIAEICEGDSKSTIENYLRAKYTTKEEATSIRRREEILEILRQRDMYLARYLEVNIHLIKPLEIDMNAVIFEWDQKEEYDSEVIYDITEGFLNMEDDCIYSASELLLYLKYKADIDVLKDLGFDLDDGIMSDSEYFEALFSNVNLKDSKILQDYRKLIEDYIKTKKEPDFYVLTEKRKKEKLKNKKSKITKINNNNDENK